MSTLKRILGVGGVLAMGAILSQAHCDNSTPTPTPMPDLATPPPSPDIAKNAAPTISGISPASIVNTGGMITITGSGFLTGATVTVGGVGCTSPTVTATQITCTAPAKTAACGSQAVVVTNTDLQAATNSTALSYRSAIFAFATKVDYTVAAGANLVAIADFNGDSKLDLAVSSRGAALNTGVVQLLTGKGDGSFNNATTIGMTLATPIGIDAGDFNADGKQDLVVALNGGTSFNLYLGKGDGTFNTPVNTGVATLTNVHGVKFADVNADGKPDVLAVANGANTSLVARLNDGAGGFGGTQPAVQAIGAISTFVATGDFNGDNKLDVVLSNPAANYLAVRTGDNTGAFGGMLNLMTVNNAGQVVTGDFNKDGKLDIAATSQNNANVAVYLGQGGATFMAATGSPFAVGTGPVGLTAVDVNGDGNLDLIAANNGGTASVSVLLGNGQGGFTGGAANTFNIAAGGFGVSTADFNGDGLVDIVTGNGGLNFNVGTSVSVLLQQCK